MAGKDATIIFKGQHPPGTIENQLDPEAFLGKVDPLTLPAQANAGGDETSGERRPHLSEIIGLPDFEVGSGFS